MRQLEIDKLTSVVKDMYNLNKRALIFRDVTAEKVERKAAELDILFDTEDFTLFVKEDFISGRDKRVAKVAVYNLYKILKGIWSYEISKNSNVRQATKG